MLLTTTVKINCYSWLLWSFYIYNWNTEKRHILILDKEVNLIQLIKSEVSTSMSSVSVWNVPATSWNSSNAIDNVTTGDPNTCSCCASTEDTVRPWLQIDLGRIYSIKEILITGRSGGRMFCYINFLWLKLSDWWIGKIVYRYTYMTKSCNIRYLLLYIKSYTMIISGITFYYRPVQFNMSSKFRL